jgi:hypothetical protein
VRSDVPLDNPAGRFYVILAKLSAQAETQGSFSAEDALRKIISPGSSDAATFQRRILEMLLLRDRIDSEMDMLHSIVTKELVMQWVPNVTGALNGLMFGGGRP